MPNVQATANIAAPSLISSETTSVLPQPLAEWRGVLLFVTPFTSHPLTTRPLTNSTLSPSAAKCRRVPSALVTMSRWHPSSNMATEVSTCPLRTAWWNGVPNTPATIALVAPSLISSQTASVLPVYQQQSGGEYGCWLSLHSHHILCLPTPSLIQHCRPQLQNAREWLQHWSLRQEDTLPPSWLQQSPNVP